MISNDWKGGGYMHLAKIKSLRASMQGMLSPLGVLRVESLDSRVGVGAISEFRDRGDREGARAR